MIGKSFTKAARVSLSSRYSWRRRKRGEEGGEGGEEEEEGDEEAGEEGGEEEVGGMRDFMPKPNFFKLAKARCMKALEDAYETCRR
ncbi:hypothetical protein NSK_006324 [Nannochloropsis salina CCMP1776]|uniref:Uncharacterized protein n=1 Tax=Nannochloropsis salina CCMP1776 TaxID=1027361 RepID=A0A4D9CT03_9STRA|nr:hypothetical protein NSK_006324 [Nannochloropsis salina CCMP1776]|eukprot:TFJ82351.1 hypothetical protein NSK_006324 [Nannochloropsis salina CCMP1776]